MLKKATTKYATSHHSYRARKRVALGNWHVLKANETDGFYNKTVFIRTLF